MACSSCGKKKRKSIPVVYSGVSVPTGYQEGQDGYSEIVYLGESVLKIRGRKTGHHYFFGVGAIRTIDSNDAQFLVSRQDFEYVQSDSSETEEIVSEDQTSDLGGDERVSSVDD